LGKLKRIEDLFTKYLFPYFQQFLAKMAFFLFSKSYGFNMGFLDSIADPDLDSDPDFLSNPDADVGGPHPDLEPGLNK
jgi:hypothetical protein